MQLMRAGRVLLAAILVFFTVRGAIGQESETPLTFEVASVKPSPANAPGMFIRPLPGENLQVTGATLKNLIALAYGVREFQISGGPAWMGADRFDIDAKTADPDPAVPTDAVSQQGRRVLERVRNLLAERFQLKLHKETREQPVFTLVVGKSGPKLQESTDTRGLVRMMGRGTLRGQAVGLNMLVINLSNQLDRRVVDKTKPVSRVSTTSS